MKGSDKYSSKASKPASAMVSAQLGHGHEASTGAQAARKKKKEKKNDLRETDAFLRGRHSVHKSLILIR